MSAEAYDKLVMWSEQRNMSAEAYDKLAMWSAQWTWQASSAGVGKFELTKYEQNAVHVSRCRTLQIRRDVRKCYGPNDGDSDVTTRTSCVREGACRSQPILWTL
eukprot:SAG31_NODE_2199_length_6208_cov_3.935996_4_plen_104_part_00